MSEINRDDVARKFGLVNLMTLEEVCAYANCSERHIQDEIRKRKLKAYKPVRGLMFDPRDVETWVKRKVLVS